MRTLIQPNRLLAALVMAGYSLVGIEAAVSAPLALRDVPVFINDNVPPLNMLVVGRDHKLYYEAYNDHSDLNGDDVLDVGFQPTIEYYGYFDAKRCYSHSGAQFNPVRPADAPLWTCGGMGEWSGNWLNYVTTSRIDALRKVLYGGRRSTDAAGNVVLERSYIPQDAHSWGKQYTSPAVDGYVITDFAPFALPAAGLRHLFANTTLLSDAANTPRLRVLENMNAQVSDWVSIERPVANDRVVNLTIGVQAVAPVDYTVRVRVCQSGQIDMLDESNNCRQYPDGNWKPTGLLHDFGETDTMLFGLLSGSYEKNTDGGVLRKAMGTVSNEIDPNTGAWTNVVGIIKTMDRFRATGFITGYQYTDPSDSCGWITNGPITAGRCRMWGNPIGEMMYEALRYFAGKGAPTAAFNIANTGNPDATLGLPKATWDNPYGATKPSCAKPFQTVISDINPSFDSDKVPGSYFTGYAGDVTGLNAAAEAAAITAGEPSVPGLKYVGQSDATYDGAPTPKMVSSLGTVRGLAPEEPTKEGSYNAASVAYFGVKNDINPVAGNQKLTTFSIALASPLPRIEIPVAGRKITLIPFAKSVGGCLGVNGTQGLFQPTNQIVDFYVEDITPTSGTFRVNFEDVEQGADHDMDAIARYHYEVNNDNTVTITVLSEYAAGCIIQHLGYIISGTTADGSYLVVRDVDTNSGAGNGNNFPAGDADYFLDTPPLGAAWNDGVPLPLASARIFSPGGSASADLLRDPLWYAAKWGGFIEGDIKNQTPDLQDEWDSNNDGDPDNYFLVTNALNLKDQLTKAFNEILTRSGSSAAAAVNSGTIREGTRAYLAEFSAGNWSGTVRAKKVNLDGTIGALVWNAATQLPAWNSRRIATVNNSGSAVPFRWTDLDLGRQAQLNPENNATIAQRRLNYLRGDRTYERRNANGIFRNRDPLSLYGDFISSSPIYVGRPPFRYTDALDGAPNNTYRKFQSDTTNANRTKMIYIGGNDGMLHAIEEATGTEMWAFIPSQAFPIQTLLSKPNYQHKFGVDGTPTMGDVYFGGAWNTVLVTPLGLGGQGLFTMNVTSPDASTESAVASKYMWSFTDQNDVDLGYTLSRPAIVRLQNNRWVAIFGNGYNNTIPDGRQSTTGNAVLYIVDVESGALLRKIDTRVGMAQDPTGTARPNGLATPAVVDVDGDFNADYAVVGDLFGNMWKFDLRGNNPSSWDSMWKVSGNPVPLFVARNASNVAQPITSRPQVGRGPNGIGLNVLFGTGKFLEGNDRILALLTPQSFYGLYDPNTGAASDRFTASPNNRSVLTVQSILTEQNVDPDGIATNGDEFNIRTTSNNVIGSNRGWYMDFLSPGPIFRGEMEVTDSVLRAGRIIFTTVIPNADPCGYGGDSWIMLLDALSGSRVDSSFDLNGDGKYNNDDKVTVGGTAMAASGRQSDVGISTRPAVVTNGASDFLIVTGTAQTADGQAASGSYGIDPGNAAEGRQSWRQIR